MEKREIVKQQLGPHAPVTEIMKGIAEMWRPLTDAQKARWIEMSKVGQTVVGAGGTTL